jgi:hypothetical protein
MQIQLRTPCWLADDEITYMSLFEYRNKNKCSGATFLSGSIPIKIDRWFIKLGDFYTYVMGNDHFLKDPTSSF